MKVNLNIGKEIFLTNKQQKYIERRLQRLVRFFKNKSEALVADIKLSDETGNTKGGVDKQVNITVQVPGEQAPIHIAEREDKILRSFNIAIAKVERQLREEHQKMVNLNRKGGRFDKIFGILSRRKIK